MGPTVLRIVFGSLLALQVVAGLPQEDSSALSPSENAISLPPSPAPSPTEAPTLPLHGAEIRKRNDWEVCGRFGDDRDEITCSSGAYCATLFHKVLPDGRVGCCSADGCDINFDCIEGKTASSAMQLGCTGKSSFCATYTWVDQNAKSYACATAMTTLTVSDSTTSRDPGEGGSSTSTDVFATSGTRTLGGPTATETYKSGNPPGKGNGHGDDDKGPALGSEADLQTRQRIGAGVGAGVFGCLLFGFFMIFGCIKRPGERMVSEKQAARESQQLLVDMQRGSQRSPGDLSRYETSPAYTPSISTAYSGFEMSPQSAYHADARSYHGFAPVPRSASDAELRNNNGFETVPIDPLNVGWR